MNTVSFPNLGLEFTVNRVAFSIGPLNITWYGLLIAAGILLAMCFGFWQCRKFGIIADKLMDAALGGVVGGIIGARLYYVAFRWEDYKDDLSNIFKTWEGGMAIYGGLIGGLLVGLLVAKLRHIRILPAMDITVMGFLIGQSIGRWGNFVNVEAFGGNTNLPWGMTSDTITAYLREHYSDLTALGMNIDPTAPVHPTFLYESLWCALGFVLLFLYSKRRRFDGEIFLMYSAWYGAGRFFFEGLRTDSLLIGNLRVSQLVAGVAVLAAVIIWIIVTVRIRSSNDPEYLKLYVLTDAYAQEVADYELKLQKKANKKKGSAEETAPAEESAPTEETASAEEDAPAEEGASDEGAAADAEESSAPGEEAEGVEVVEIGSFQGEESPDAPAEDDVRPAEDKDNDEQKKTEESTNG